MFNDVQLTPSDDRRSLASFVNSIWSDDVESQAVFAVLESAVIVL